MLSLHSTQSLVTTIALIIAYVISVTISGSLQALIAAAMGDNTARDEGFASGNPIPHIDFVGLILVVITGFGWSSPLPIDPSHIRHTFRFLRLALVYGAKTLVSIIIALISLVTLIVIYGGHSIQAALIMFFTDTTVLQNLTKLYPHYSSLGIVFAIILMAFIFINSFLATWEAINNSFQYALVVGFENNYAYMQYAHYLQILGPVLVLILFGDKIHSLFLYSIIQVAEIFAKTLGA